MLFSNKRELSIVPCYRIINTENLLRKKAVINELILYGSLLYRMYTLGKSIQISTSLEKYIGSFLKFIIEGVIENNC
jgi:hypothetical protein